MEDPNRAEAERLLGISEKLLQTRDLTGSRDFAILAQETEPLLDGSDQILAVTDVLLAAEKRMNNHHDWYSILQLDRRSDDQELIKKQYRRLALLLHPDKNKFPLADQAFKLVADAWAVLNDTAKKALYDNELTLFSKVDLTSVLQAKLPVRRNMRPSPSTTTGNNNTNTNNNNSSSSSKKDQRHGNSSSNNNNSSGNFHQEDQRLRMSSFWTMCPYCYNLFEYPRVYEGCCLRCQNCQRAFHAAVIPSLPPVVPGQDAYYCCWGFFPMGFVVGSSDQNNNNNNNNNNTSNSNATKTPPSAAAAAPTGGATTYPNWMPQPQESGRNGGAVVAAAAGETRNAVIVNLNGNNNNNSNNNNSQMRLTKKRGRPRKYSVQS